MYLVDTAGALSSRPLGVERNMSRACCRSTRRNTRHRPATCTYRLRARGSSPALMQPLCTLVTFNASSRPEVAARYRFDVTAGQLEAQRLIAPPGISTSACGRRIQHLHVHYLISFSFLNHRSSLCNRLTSASAISAVCHVVPQFLQARVRLT